MGETFYDVLEVGRDASQEDIETAYRERVKETHPDLNDSPEATDAFQRVQSAEEVLGDPDERARYDRLGHASYTGHFGARPAEGGNGWDFGSDRTGDEARDGGSGRGNDRGGADDADGFGFDPGAYDETRERDGDGNPSERSYDVGGGADDRQADASEAGTGGATASTGTGGTGGSNASSASMGGGAGTATSGRGPSTGSASAGDVNDWQERARRTQREWSKESQRRGRDSTDEDDSGYSVHDWDEADLETESDRYSLQGSEIVVISIMFLLYPFMAYSAVTPQFSVVVNLVVAVCALALVGYLLTMPRIGFAVFGAWSVIAPVLFLVVPALEVVSLVGLVMLGTTWIPLGYSILFLQVLD